MLAQNCVVSRLIVLRQLVTTLEISLSIEKVMQNRVKSHKNQGKLLLEKRNKSFHLFRF